MTSAHELLKEARLRAGKSEAEAANAAGVPLENYYDLEAHDDEICYASSILELKRICHSLGIKISSLFPTPTQVAPREISFSLLADLLRGHIASNSLDLAEFEERVGWELQSILQNPESAWNWPLDQLKHLCRELGIDWVNVIGTIDQKVETSND